MKKLSAYLSETKTTQKAFAALVGVEQSTVSRWVNGTGSPEMVTAFKIERVTDGEVAIQSWIAPDLTPFTGANGAVSIATATAPAEGEAA